MVFQFGGLLTNAEAFRSAWATITAIIVTALMIYLLVRKPAKADGAEGYKWA